MWPSTSNLWELVSAKQIHCPVRSPAKSFRSLRKSFEFLIFQKNQTDQECNCNVSMLRNVDDPIFVVLKNSLTLNCASSWCCGAAKMEV